MKKIFYKQGSVLIEAIIALAIFAMVAASLISLSAGTFNPWLKQEQLIPAENFAQAGLEAARSIAATNWSGLNLNVSGLAYNAGAWQLMGEGTHDASGIYTRQLLISQVNPHLLLITAQVSWQDSNNQPQTITRQIYLSDWRS